MTETVEKTETPKFDDKPGNDERRQTLLAIYGLYLERVCKEGDWFWLRFGLFLSLNLGGLGALGLLLKEPLASFPRVSIGLLAVIAFFALGGAALTRTWEAVVRDGGEWQAYFTEKLARIETDLGEQRADAYRQIHAVRDVPAASSIVRHCISVAVAFRWFYVSLAFLAVGLMY